MLTEKVQTKKHIVVQKKKRVNRISVVVLFFTILLTVFFGEKYLFSDTRKELLRQEVNDEKVWSAIKNLPLPEQNFDKMMAEIRRIKAGNRRGNSCEQYA